MPLRFARAAGLLVLAGLLAAPVRASAGPAALFDNTHAETAGNADWQIDTDQPLPLPDQATVTAATPRTYWTGAISSWAIDLVKRGYSVATLTSAYGITYGNAANPYDLSRFDVFIVAEPNTRFTSAESTAIFHYVQDGGGLVAVADHNFSDRNNDGFDSPRIWNLLDRQHFFGAHFDTTGEANNNFSQDSGNIDTLTTNPITHGPEGVADSLAFHGGTAMTLYPAVNPSVAGDVWTNGSVHGTTNVMAAHATYGNGRIFFVGDSSPVDDGSAAPGNSNIFDGWAEVSGRDSLLLMNATRWVTRRCAPEITGFSPATGGIGSSVAITGRRLLAVTAVRFNGVPASFTPATDTTLTAIVPGGATPGPIAVAGACGTDTSDAIFYPPGWSACGIPVTHVAGAQQLPALAPDGAGGTIVAWQDHRGADDDIYVQRLGAGGQPLWTVDGVALCTATGNQTAPVIAADAAGGAIVAWQDLRGATSDVYAARIDANGVPLWTTRVCDSADDELAPAITGDGASGAFVAWLDERGTGGSGANVAVQHLDAAGAVLWGAGGTLLTTGGGLRSGVTVAPDAASGAYVGWVDVTGQAAKVARTGAGGVVLWQYELVQMNGAMQQQLAADGSGGVVAAIGGADLYCARITADAVSLWPGTPVCSQAGTQDRPSLAVDPDGGAFVAWSDGRVAAANLDVYAQHVGASGLAQWTAQGVAVCTAAGNQAGTRIVSTGAGTATLAWQDARGGAGDVYAQRLDAAGAPVWTTNGRVVCAAAGDQADPVAVPDLSGGAYVAWNDDGGSIGDDVQAMRLRADGSVAAVPAPAAARSRLEATPNPANGDVHVRFALEAPADVRLEVFDVNGRRVREAPAVRLGGGSRTLVWDGRAAGGARVAGGIYFVHVSGAGFHWVCPVTHVR